MPWRNDATPRNTAKAGSPRTSELAGKSGVLAGDHAGGHSDVANMQTKLAGYGLTPGKANSNTMRDMERAAATSATSAPSATGMKKQIKPTSVAK